LLLSPFKALKTGKLGSILVESYQNLQNGTVFIAFLAVVPNT